MVYFPLSILVNSSSFFYKLMCIIYKEEVIDLYLLEYHFMLDRFTSLIDMYLAFILALTYK